MNFADVFGQLNTIIKANSHQTTGKELNDYLAVARYFYIIWKSKSSTNRWSMNENQKNRHYEICSLFFYATNNKSSLDRIKTCDEKLISYHNRRSSKQWLNQQNAPKTTTITSSIGQLKSANYYPRRCGNWKNWATTRSLHHLFKHLDNFL